VVTVSQVFGLSDLQHVLTEQRLTDLTLDPPLSPLSPKNPTPEPVARAVHLAGHERGPLRNGTHRIFRTRSG
jgi:hypothetical protein